MKNDQDSLHQIASALAGHFESLYYVDIETDHFFEYSSKGLYKKLDIEKEGEDFFRTSQINAEKCVHPDDLERVKKIHDKETMLKHLAKDGAYTTVYRLVIDGTVVRFRHIEMMCEDRKHIICCLENIEDEERRNDEQTKVLQSARRMARRDELTGVRNKNAYQEFVGSIDGKIKAGMEDYHVGVVICDVNDLKVLNDTRGHSFGDEAIQRTGRMICDTFDHSPVFRIGGDEFAVVLTDRDYEDREKLLNQIKEESMSNARMQSGPVVACGMASYNPGSDEGFSEIFERADKDMYKNKHYLKSTKLREGIISPVETEIIPIPPERKQKLDSMFGALYTVAGEGYVFLNDMIHDYSRWSVVMVDDFDMPSEYMYHAGKIWEDRVHPDDLKKFQEIMKGIFTGGTVSRNIRYRVRDRNDVYVWCTNRGFVLSNPTGGPEYFGGIMVMDS